MSDLRELERLAKAELAPVWHRIDLFRIDQCEASAAYLIRAFWEDRRGRTLGHSMTLPAKLVFSDRAWAVVSKFAHRTVRAVRMYDLQAAMQSLVLPWMPVEVG